MSEKNEIESNEKPKTATPIRLITSESYFICSECGTYVGLLWKACKRCGAEMDWSRV